MSYHSYSYSTSRTVGDVGESSNEINESSDWQTTNRTVTYDQTNYQSYDNPIEEIPVSASEHTEITSQTPRVIEAATSSYQTTVAEVSSTSDGIIYTKNNAETDRYLDEHGITICKGPDVIRRTVYGDAVDQEQRICLRYLQPPPLPKPGPLTIEEIRKPTVTTSKLVIREQDTVAEAAPPLVLRERPPTPPVIPGPEKKTVIIPTEPIQQRSVVIERHAAVKQRPRDIVIERWLPYGPIPEREVIVKKVDQQTELSKQTCTIVNYEYPQGRLSRRVVVVDVHNADPNDYRARYRESLLNSSQLLEEARRVGVTEDISSPSSVSVGTNVERKTVDYRQSRDSFCDCFSSGFTGVSVDAKLTDKSSYSFSSRSAEVTSTMKSEY